MHAIFPQVILIHPETMPGGSYSNLNLGDTLVHEMGHYLGLLHTFSSKSGTCSEETDDKVDDTPIEASPNYGCSARDSCSGFSGGDPIWSFMDYTKDACMTRFSPGQVGHTLRTAPHFPCSFSSSAVLHATLMVGS